MVNDSVGQMGCRYLTLQAVIANFRGELLCQYFGKVVRQLELQIFIVGNIGCYQCIVIVHFAVGVKNRNLRLGQSPVAGLTVRYCFGIRKIFQRTVQAPTLLKISNETCVFIQLFRRFPRHQADRLGLCIVVCKHQLGNFIRHLNQQPVALFLCHLSICNDLAKQYLDVHLMIRTIHSR